jgi:DNA gyrase inhibitor GyrI
MTAIITHVGWYQKAEETCGVLIKYATANRA